MQSLNSTKQSVAKDSYYCPMMVYWELTWLWGHQRSFKESIKDFSLFQIIYYSKIMIFFFPMCIKITSKMWQWQGSNDYVLTSTSLNLNFQQIINLAVCLFLRLLSFFPKCCFEYFVFRITWSVSKLSFWRTGKPCYQGKEVRDLFLYILPLFSIQTWQILHLK